MIALLLVAEAHASACCVGTLSDQPAQLGRCEKMGAALGVGSAIELGAFDSQGRWGATSDAWVQSSATLGIAGRWARWGSASLAIPAVVSARSAAGEASLGGGVGDVSLSTRLEPWEEGNGPRPAFTLGLLAPTGRGWEDAEDPADVTGVGAWTASAGMALERTGVGWPWRVGVEGSVGGERATLVGAASIGRYFGTRWTVAGALTGKMEGGGAGWGVRPAVDVRLVHGQPRKWRAWLNAGTDLPVAGMSAHGEARVGAGVLVVR